MRRRVYIFMTVAERRPVYYQNGATLIPWTFSTPEVAQSVLGRMEREGKQLDGHPFTREWVDIVELDADDEARYQEFRL